jgi:hypothetical protein
MTIVTQNWLFFTVVIGLARGARDRPDPQSIRRSLSEAPMIPLVPVHESILSSYSRDGKTGGPRENLRPLHTLTALGVAHPMMATQLKRLNDAVLAAGGDFRVTECHRDYATQAAARAKYDAWVAAGKPKPGTAQFNPRSMKAAFVATPGRSMHNAGRAIDIHVGLLNFPNTPSDRQLDRFWDICRPLGWEPVIRQATEGASESWHFDWWGDLSGVRNRLGYEQAALCGAILVGHGDLNSYAAKVQALLSRAGYDIGKIDGVAGRQTQNALQLALGRSDVDRVLQSRDAGVLTTLLGLNAG